MIELVRNSPRQFVLAYWFRWLDRHIKPARKSVLDQKRIFIFPTREGGFFLLMILGLFFGGVNYQNSLILAMSFFLCGLLLVTVYHTYRNLSGLQVEASHVTPCFAGGHASFCINLSRAGRRTYQGVFVGWHDDAMQVCSLVRAQEANVTLSVLAAHRGWCRPGRVKIYTIFPLGLIRAWCWVDLGFKSLVYPKPIENTLYQSSALSEETGKSMGEPGVDDFEALRVYRSGDPLKHVHWKMLARNDQLYSKTFTSEQQENHWLEWQGFPHADVEHRLSCMCYGVLALSSADAVFGLRLPSGDIPPNKGLAHKAKCLAALALYGVSEEASGVLITDDLVAARA